MNDSTREGFLHLREDIYRQITDKEKSAVRALWKEIPDWQRPSSYIDLGNSFTELSFALRNRLTRSAFIFVNRLLVIELVLCLHESLSERNIPSDVLELYPAAASRLLAYLHDVIDLEYYYPNEFFVKDLRFSAGLTVPCGAQVVDLRGIIGHKSSICVLFHGSPFQYLSAFVHFGKIVPWFRIHTESRYLNEFNESGWDACYMRVASLIREHPSVLGVVGTSWFFDPQIALISPRLSYLRSRPIKRGAFFIRGRTSEFDIRSAIYKSNTRRLLYDTGRYMPTPYTLLWPRRALLNWADNQGEEKV